MKATAATLDTQCPNPCPDFSTARESKLRQHEAEVQASLTTLHDDLGNDLEWAGGVCCDSDEDHPIHKWRYDVALIRDELARATENYGAEISRLRAKLESM